jgi:hypothetical protein
MSVEPLLLCREDSTYSLTIDVEVDRRVIRRKDTVGRSDNWASGHDVCCVCSVCGCRCLYVSKSEAVKGLPGPYGCLAASSVTSSCALFEAASCL